MGELTLSTLVSGFVSCHSTQYGLYITIEYTLTLRRDYMVIRTDTFQVSQIDSICVSIIDIPLITDQGHSV